MSSRPPAGSALIEPAPQLVVMGVSGCGKSTIGRMLASALKLPYVEGDELHPPRNIALMAAGTPLTDDDRDAWLAAVAARISDAGGIVISCSALKRRYRDRLRQASSQLRFIHLHGSPELLASRMTQRQGHYMPASLLQSQLHTLEVPGADEAALAADIAAAPQDIVASLCAQLQQPLAQSLST